MMLKLIPLTALALGLSSGVALADRHGGDHRGATVEHRAAPQQNVSRDHRYSNGAIVVRDHNNYYGGGRAVVRPSYGGNRTYGNYGNYGNNRSYGRGFYGGRVEVRRPIYVSRPVIRERYYNYYRRPALIVENFNPMAGYYWVPGSWTWSGYEWIWQPGHYQPDPSYYDNGYGYDNGY